MAETRLIVNRKKNIRDCYWELKNVVEMQRQFRSVLEKELSTRLKISKIRTRFEARETLQNVHKQCSRRPWSSINTENKKRLVNLIDTRWPVRTFRIICPLHFKAPILENLHSKNSPRSQ